MNENNHIKAEHHEIPGLTSRGKEIKTKGISKELGIKNGKSFLNNCNNDDDDDDDDDTNN
jgi:hypothetical protein